MTPDVIIRLPFETPADRIISAAKALAAQDPQGYGRVVLGTNTRVRYIGHDSFQVGSEGSRADHYQRMTEAELRIYIARVVERIAKESR